MSTFRQLFSKIKQTRDLPKLQAKPLATKEAYQSLAERVPGIHEYTVRGYILKQVEIPQIPYRLQDDVNFHSY
jgi:hypothetical protein